MMRELTHEEEKLRKLYLRDLATGKIQGPPTGKASVDMPWFQWYDEDAITLERCQTNIYDYFLAFAPDNVPLLEYYGREYYKNDIIDITQEYIGRFSSMGIKEGDTVGIIGIGPIGLMFARLAKLKGAKVIVAGRNPLKLQMADEFAHADEIVDLKKYPNPEKIFLDFTEEHKGLDVAVECVGLPEIWERIFTFVRPGGTVHFFGGCKSGSKVTFDTTKMHYGDIRLMSVFHHTPKYFRQALNYIASGDVEVEKLITKTIGLKDIEWAMNQHIEGKAIKFLVKPWENLS